jgi:hypothetical protein
VRQIPETWQPYFMLLLNRPESPARLFIISWLRAYNDISNEVEYDRVLSLAGAAYHALKTGKASKDEEKISQAMMLLAERLHAFKQFKAEQAAKKTHEEAKPAVEPPKQAEQPAE